MVVRALVCNKCKDAVYSRTRHDMRWCSCGSCAIDGGQEDYIQVTGTPGTFEIILIEVNATLEELYRDWNKGIDKFGLVKASD